MEQKKIIIFKKLVANAVRFDCSCSYDSAQNRVFFWRFQRCIEWNHEHNLSCTSNHRRDLCIC